jgi:sulfur transfer protein SufE
MALKTLEKIITQAKVLTTRDAQAVWVRSQAKHAPNDLTIRDMPNFVPGCEHPVWMSYVLTERGIKFAICCDGSDSQGVAGIIVQALNGLTAQEIRALDFSEFRDIARYLNNRQQRTLNAMLNRIKDTIGSSE